MPIRSEFFHRVSEELKHSNTYLLTADLGYSYIEPLMRRHPDRVINVGIAETAMIGIAKGLADEGKKVFCYSMAPFLIFRPLELLRLIAPAGGDIILVGYQTQSPRAGRSHLCARDDIRACEIAGIDLCSIEGAFAKGQQIRYLRLEA